MQRLNTAVNYNEKSINGCAVHLTRKVKVPSNTVLQCVEWNLNTNFIASGGSGGLLKVLKLACVDIGSFKDSKGGTPMNMSVNQALEGHSGTVLCAAWNELQQKLTTSDSNGLIIVWSLHNESWYEEMINNRRNIIFRNKSMVVGMAWNNDGSKIAIAYQDGQVIVGTMDGNRIWNKELPGNIAACEWSPDGSILLFGMADGEVHSYDNQGTFLQKLHMIALESVELETALAKDLRKDNIIALKWFTVAPRSRVYDSSDRGSSPMPFRHGQNVSSPMPPRLNRLQSVDPLPHASEPRIDNRPRLLIAYAHGVVQLMRNDNDTCRILPILRKLKLVNL
uniref:WD_REPEATS_REGION domain-containing protein n=1 Tax=Heterorhabditis bacteriophora TaxID=37862 RepID=A0A1I7X3Y6_HETBA